MAPPQIRQTLRLTALAMICFLLAFLLLTQSRLQFLHNNHHHEATLKPHPTLAKVMLMVGNQTNDIYERAIRTHQNHASRHGYSMFVQRQPLVDGAIHWSKSALLLSTLLRELGKPDNERLRWLMWVDYDTIVLNQNIPMEVFLPGPEWDEKFHFLISNDFNGLNAGVFFIRVHPWSVDFMSALLAYRHYNADVSLYWHDQSAMVKLLEDPVFNRHTLELPWGWFNAYDGDALHRESQETQESYGVRQGDFLVHLAGIEAREVGMSIWLKDFAERNDPRFDVEFERTSRASEVMDFWEMQHQQRIGHEDEVR